MVQNPQYRSYEAVHQCGRACGWDELELFPGEVIGAETYFEPVGRPALSEWARCRRWIARAAEEGSLADSIETIERSLLDGTYRLVAGENCAAVVEVAEYDGTKAIIIRFAGGDLDELLNSIEPAVYAEGKHLGCEIVVGEGRWGWKKPAEAHGYRLAWITMIKDIK